MDERGVNLDLDQLWPPASELLGLQFDSPEEFARAKIVLWEHLDVYRWVWEKSLLIAVRKADAHLFRDSGLTYSEVEIIDAPQNSSEEERTQERETLKQAMGWWLKELGWVK